MPCWRDAGVGVLTNSVVDLLTDHIIGCVLTDNIAGRRVNER